MRGLRKQIDDRQEDVLVLALIREIELSAYRIVKLPDDGSAGFTFEPPSGSGAR